MRVSTPATFPPLVALYSAVLGVFVPSGGSKWVIEAPYVMEAAHTLKVHLGWVVSAYDLGEALANLLQPFWMLPILGLFELGARDVMGYTIVVFLALDAGRPDSRHAARDDAAVSALTRTARSPSAGHRLVAASPPRRFFFAAADSGCRRTTSRNSPIASSNCCSASSTLPRLLCALAYAGSIRSAARYSAGGLVEPAGDRQRRAEVVVRRRRLRLQRRATS